MSCGQLVNGPFGLDAQSGQTCVNQRTVLVAVHTVTAGLRLADVVPLLESDLRVQVVYTQPPGSVISAGAARYLAELGGVVIPWEQARQTQFDLAIAASRGRLEQLHAPVLALPHGIGFNKFAPRHHGPGRLAPREVAGLERSGLIFRGRVIPSAIVVPTRAELTRLAAACPPAATVAAVAGDPCQDRLAVSLPFRDTYRQALGTGGRTLVAVTSTWGAGSLLQRQPELLAALVAHLPPDEFQVAVIFHPNAWNWHSHRQIRAWFAGAPDRGLVMIPPESGWRAVLAAADVAIGDHGSVTCYAAAAGLPVMLASYPGTEIEPGSVVSRLAAAAPRLSRGRPAAVQLADAMASWRPEVSATIRAGITDAPGQAAQLIRRLMYRLLSLPEPQSAPLVGPDPLPAPYRPEPVPGRP